MEAVEGNEYVADLHVVRRATGMISGRVVLAADPSPLDRAGAVP